MKPTLPQAERYYMPPGTHGGDPALDGHLLLGDAQLLEVMVSSLKKLPTFGGDPREQKLRVALRLILLREKYALPLWQRLREYKNFGAKLTGGSIHCQGHHPPPRLKYYAA